jgi:dipeptidyl aminopeptidase/acylaminoacyl peptidase
MTVLFVVEPMTALAGTIAAPPPLDAYGELPRIEDVAISPNGSSTASVVHIKGQRRVLVLDKDATPIMNVPAGAAKVRAIEWADDSTVLVTTTATVPVVGFTASKLELLGTIILPLKPGAAAGLVFGKSEQVADTTRGRYGMRTIDNRTIGFFGGIAYRMSDGARYLDHARTTLYAVDLQTNRPRMVAPPAEEGHYRDWLVDARGTVGAMLDLTASTGVWRIKVPNGPELMRGVDPTGDVSLIAFGQTGDTVIYQIEDQGGNSRWFEVALAGGTPKEILANVSIDRIFVDRRTGSLIGYRTLDEEPKTVMNDPAQQSALTRIFRAFKGREAELVDWTPDFTKVIVRTTGSSDSGTVYLVDVAQRRADPIGFVRPTILPENVGPISLVSYKAQDGLEMNGVLTLPPGREPKNLPIVVLPHGGPASHDTASFDWWAQAFASRGYAVFQPNFRGSTGRSDAFRHAGDGQWGRKMQTDISDGLAMLTARGTIDPKRACIVGASYGGYAALAGVTLQQGLYRCAVAVGGVSDLKMMYATDLHISGGSQMTGRSLREQLGDPKGYDAVSPRRFAAKADAPILLIHGKDDTVVSYRQSQAMADALKDAGKPYELVPLAGEDHWLSREETRKRMLAESMRFVQKYNPAD